ncbi:pentatricopeptide repeat-containing protein At4g33170-like isoform X1 [Phalaenopsis equestris]|uniref:pentatricopeptide repeat-containing protein At4g33170-like isoform X1 n=1 Tax=Phalaenopsis equestris TaxID=78828 RepID=UPI0009E264C4|nr:pentatricopeptide repeat-containing protein At4g33170-like isoform X1 [Phalaenopsis equestris]
MRPVPLFSKKGIPFPPVSTSAPLLHKLFSSSVSLTPEIEAEYFSRILQRCARTSNLLLGAAIHSLLLKSSLLSSSPFLHNHLLNMYFKSSADTSLSLQLFDEMPQPNLVSWSVVIAGLVQSGHARQALSFFNQMLRCGTHPNEFALVSALHAGSLSGGLSQARQVFSHVIRLGFESNVFLINAFLMALIRNNVFEEALELFEKCLIRDVVTWNSMIAGYLQFDCVKVWDLWRQMNLEGVSPDEYTFSSVLTGLATSSSLINGLQVHAELVKHGFREDICAGNSLLHMYIKNRTLTDGFKVFEEMPHRDVAAWTQMASGCLHCGQPSEAIEIIKLMKAAGICPNKFTLATELNACASLASLEQGKKAHGFRIKLGVEVDECVDNALIDMYSKCGSMKDACSVFWFMKARSVISWTTVIMGFAQNGFAFEAIEAFEHMISSNEMPNYITLICVLHACSQGGFVDEGWKYFTSMVNDYGVYPGEDHYCCMVDLLGKAGKLREAEELILGMPFRPGTLVWQTLLGACGLHGEVEIGKRAAENVLAAEKKDPSTYVLLSNMLAKASNWDGVRSVRELMQCGEVERIAGSSWTLPLL